MNIRSSITGFCYSFGINFFMQYIFNGSQIAKTFSYGGLYFYGAQFMRSIFSLNASSNFIILGLADSFGSTIAVTTSNAIQAYCKNDNNISLYEVFLSDIWINLIKKMSNIVVENSVSLTMQNFGLNYVEKFMIGIIPSIIIYNSIEDLMKKKIIGFNQSKKDITIEEIKMSKFGVALNNIPFRFTEDVRFMVPELIQPNFSAFYISFVDGIQCVLNEKYSINSLVFLPEYLSEYLSSYLFENDLKLPKQKSNIEIEEKKGDNNQQIETDIECMTNNDLVFNVH